MVEGKLKVILLVKQKTQQDLELCQQFGFVLRFALFCLEVAKEQDIKRKN